MGYWLMKNQLKLPDLSSLRYDFKLVSSQDEMNQALALLHDAYVESGYMEPSVHKMRITPYHMSPETIIAIAKDGDKVIATTSLILRGPLGLPIEAMVELDSNEELDGRIVEVSALAIHRKYSGQFGKLLFPMMKFIYHCAVDVLGANFEVIGVNPKMRALYEGLLLFKPLTTSNSDSSYSFVNGAPVIPMYYNLNTREATYRSAYQLVPSRSNLWHFFSEPLPDKFLLPNSISNYRSPVCDKEYFEDLFVRKSDCFQNITDSQKKFVVDSNNLVSSHKASFTEEGVVSDHSI